MRDCSPSYGEVAAREIAVRQADADAVPTCSSFHFCRRHELPHKAFLTTRGQAEDAIVQNCFQKSRG